MVRNKTSFIIMICELIMSLKSDLASIIIDTQASCISVFNAWRSWNVVRINKIFSHQMQR